MNKAYPKFNELKEEFTHVPQSNPSPADQHQRISPVDTGDEFNSGMKGLPLPPESETEKEMKRRYVEYRMRQGKERHKPK